MHANNNRWKEPEKRMIRKVKIDTCIERTNKVELSMHATVFINLRHGIATHT